MNQVAHCFRDGNRLLKPAVFVCASLIGVAMLCVPATAMSARLVWNFTPSIPTGLYSLEDRLWGRGDRVALKPTGLLLAALQEAAVLKDGRLLMKRVAAVAGDTVCRMGLQVSVNATPAASARADQALPAWSGCIQLQPGDVFLLGETEDSFDGRYFGVTSATDVVGPVRSVLTF